MRTETQIHNLISHIETFPERLFQVVNGLSEQQLLRRYRPESWTVRQVIHHIADSHMNGYSRMKMVLTEENPILKSYEEKDWAKTADVALISTDVSVAILRGLHARWSVFLKSLPNESWSRKGTHTGHGEMTLEDLLAEYAEHGDLHLEHIIAALK